MADFPKLARIKQDDENMEKLHCAARRGQTEIIRRLIAGGISPVIANKFGCTALHLACKHGHVLATRELVPISDTSIAWHGKKPLHLAVQSGNVEVIQVLVQAQQQAGKDVASFLNENDEYVTDEIGRYAKEIHGQTALHLAIGIENQSMVQLLLSLGASPTSKDRNGETPIMRAIEFGQKETFKLLLQSQPKGSLRLDICDKQGRSSLHWALLHNQPEMAQALLDYGHEVNIEDGEKVTPFLLAAYGGFPALLDQILQNVDQFMFQSAQFHNGVTVLPERMQWMKSADEASKVEVQKLLQKKLDAFAKERAQTAASLNATHTGKGGKAAGPAAPLSVAPSAPIKK
jgi:ankyrin repeat protein